MIGGRIKAAGAVLWRAGGAGSDGVGGADSGEAGSGDSGSAEVEVALIHRPRYDDWSFPKGKAEPGEHQMVTALREIEEETGYRCVLGRRLPDTEFVVAGRPKRVRYWAATPVGGSGFEPNDEVDAIAWLPAAEARKRLTSPLDAVVLDAFLDAPVPTYPIVLQRHGKAERRGIQYPDDLSRPLAEAGVEQADSLAVLLAAYGAQAVVSSPAVRCLGTIRPYAERADLPVRTDAALTEISYVHAPRAVVSWLRELVAQRRGTVVCTHGPLLDELISAVLYNPGLGGSAGLDHGPTLAGQPWGAQTADRWANDPLPTGCAWVLHFDATVPDGEPPRLLAVDRLKP
jgi:8-oxo-dGTP diphosphatase